MCFETDVAEVRAGLTRTKREVPDENTARKAELKTKGGAQVALHKRITDLQDKVAGITEGDAGEDKTIKTILKSLLPDVAVSNRLQKMVEEVAPEGVAVPSEAVDDTAGGTNTRIERMVELLDEMGRLNELVKLVNELVADGRIPELITEVAKEEGDLMKKVKELRIENAKLWETGKAEYASIEQRKEEKEARRRALKDDIDRLEKELKEKEKLLEEEGAELEKIEDEKNEVLNMCAVCLKQNDEEAEALHEQMQNNNKFIEELQTECAKLGEKYEKDYNMVAEIMATAKTAFEEERTAVTETFTGHSKALNDFEETTSSMRSGAARKRIEPYEPRVKSQKEIIAALQGYSEHLKGQVDDVDLEDLNKPCLPVYDL